MSEPKDLRKLFEVWVDSELKAQIVVFFNENPGVVETLEGLARRLGTNVEALRTNIADHIELGLLKERQVGGKTVLMFDRNRRQEISDEIARLTREKEDKT